MNEKFGFAPFGLVIIFQPTLGGIWMQTQFMVCQACHKNRYQIQLFPGKEVARRHRHQIRQFVVTQLTFTLSVFTEII